MLKLFKQLLINKRLQFGNITIFVLIFGVIFSIVIGGIVTLAAIEFTGVQRNQSVTQALAVAEAGVSYYRWHLAHAPQDYQDGTGQPGPYVHQYLDPEGAVLGEYSLEIFPPEEGSNRVIVESTGYTTAHPEIKRKIRATFGPIPLTRYSFFHNSNVWFGQGIEIFGEVFSNGGIRMDGLNQSIVGSSKESYTCGLETGCVDPETKEGVWGKGGPEELWVYPVSFFDFDSIVTDFALIKAEAQSQGLYRGPSGGYGYHLVFENDGTVDLFRVNSAQNEPGWEVENGCVNLYQHIQNETLLGTYSLADNKIIYLEDTTWVDGQVNGMTTVVAARLPVNTFKTDIWITDNLTYVAKDGTNNLGLIAQGDIVFGEDLPQKFYIDGAMLAQSGRVLRHHYNMNKCSKSNKATRLELNVYGSIISNLKSYWNFSGPQGPTSGFTKRELIYNPEAEEVPPPYFPYSGQVTLLSWDEVDVD